MWDRLSVQWKLDLSQLVSEITLAELPAEIERILGGKMVGRTLVNLT